ncbi:hypothetical protein ACLKA7_015581 [Drosophila subpalustris]
MDKDCFKTPPNMVYSNHTKQGQPKNNTNEILMSSPMQSPSPSQSAATAPKRIINKIPLDFNKLKQAGLDRKLAEVLSKQNLSAARKIASATTTTTSSSASTSSAAAAAAKLSIETASLTQVQQQRERLTAALPVRKKTAPNLVTVDEQSLHIKSLIKNKILNKLANSPGTTAATTTATRTTAPASPEVRSSPTNSYTAPIAKADLTARPKLLLNLVNQLPKHRAMCSGVRTSPARARQQESTPQPRVRQQPSSTYSLSPQLKPPRQEQLQCEDASYPKPLIVLENKVLAPNEKIDLSALHLPKILTTEVSSIAMPVPEKLNEIPERPHVRDKSAPRLLQVASTTSGSGAKKFILNANKLKVPREQIAQMARDISKQSNQRKQQPITNPVDDVNDISSNITELSSTTSIESSLITLNPKTTNIQTSLITPVVAEVLPNPKLTSAKNSFAPPSPAASDPPNNVISAVDFIAQLKANNSMNSNNYMNLSAEEMSMNALFSSCPPALPTPEENKAEEEELPIGKILKMEDMDILHSTMNVDENESNVLCISPNAIKLQKSIKIEEPPMAKETASLEADSSFLKEALEPLSTKGNLNLKTAPAVVVTAPQEETKLPEEPVKEGHLAQLLPLATRSASFRPKRGKINLVQRNKKARAEKPKSTVEPVKIIDMEIDVNVGEAYIPEEERDLTQLYHPPKMPKLKQKINNNNEEMSSKDVTAETQPSISLLEVLSQEQPISQGEAQLPFRPEPKKAISAEKSSTEVTGIQNLLNKLAAENVMPLSKEIKEIKTEEPAKAPRKKLVKTRPVLGAKRATKVASPKTEALPPRKRALLAESKANGAHRVPTSSTSDDDGDVFHGFDNEASSSERVKNLKNMETDISDDATPDYDETEEEPQPVEISLTKKPKTESTSTELKLEKIPEQVDNENEGNPEPEETMKEILDSQGNPELDQDISLQVELVVAKKKRGRPFKKANSKPEETTTVDKTEEAATPLPRIRKRQRKDISKDLTQSGSTGDLAVAQQDSLCVAEDTPVVKRPRKSRAKINTTITTPAELDTTTETKTVKRRRRKPKITQVDAVIETTPDAMITATPDPMITSTPDPMIASRTDAMITSTPGDMVTPKKRGRRPKFFDLMSKKAKTENNTESAEEMGTPEGSYNWPQTPDFDLRLLLIRSREQLESGEELCGDGQGQGSEQCGLCLVRCNKNDWETHLSEHYGIGWTTDKAPEVITRGLLITMLNNYAKGGNRFSCRLCDRTLGSGLGLIMHLENCGIKQERVECDVCKKSYSKLYFAQHYRTCSQRHQPTVTSIEEKADESANSIVYSNAGRAKRKSTIKAESKLHKIAAHLKKQDEPDNKDFDADSSDYDDAADKESSEEYDSEGVDSNEDADQTKAGSSCTINDRKRPTSRASSTSSKPPFSRIIKSGDSSADRWKFFIQTNYAKDMLYPHLLPRYKQLLPDDAIKLLPSRESISMRYAYDNEEENVWVQLAPLETLRANTEHLCHLGRPVKEVAWVPLPSTVDTQYLLCSQRPKMHGFTRQMKDKQADDLLLLLECTMSSADKEDIWPLQTRLHYGIRVSLGTVNSFAFMPSGGYDKSANRLALLAVGSTSGAVIYSLPLQLAKIEENVEQKDAVIALEPVLTLSLDVDNPVRDPCTKICWSQASGHNLIVTGFASGNIAFWDIADENGLNCFEQNSHRHFLPASFFYFGERNIQSLELHYDTNGARWLAVGAAVRKFWVYDISNWSQPLSLVGDLIKYLYLGCISWSPLWESFIIGCSEIIRPQFTRLVSISPVDISSHSVTLGLMLNSIRDTHFNCDQNTLASIADNGDVAFLKSSEPFSHSVLRRKSDIYSLSMTEACHLSDGSKQELVTPEVFQRDYGLILRPFRIEQKRVKGSIYKNPKRQPSFSVRSLMRLNCVRWNWNDPASSWVAIGAEHGLLRIMNYDYES